MHFHNVSRSALRKIKHLASEIRILNVSNTLKKKEFKLSVLPKPDGLLACLIPSSAIEAANRATRKIFTNYTIDEDSHSLQ